MRALVALSLLMLVGCAADREARWLTEAGSACEAYGFQPGTPEHAQCTMLVVENKKADHAALLRALATMPVSRPVTCTHYGNFSRCQ